MRMMMTNRTKPATFMAPVLGRRPIAIASMILIVDQLTKSLVRVALAPCHGSALAQCDVAHIGPVSFIRVGNGGGAFGFAQGLVVWVIVAAIGLVLIPLYAKIGRSGLLLALAVGLQVGGVVGNLLDRVVLGQVTDFIYFGRGVAFNFADVALFVGTVIATVQLYRAIASRPALFGAERESR